MSATPPSGSPRTPTPHDTSVSTPSSSTSSSSFSSFSDDEALPTSTAAVVPPTVSSRAHPTAAEDEGDEPDALQAEPQHTDVRVRVRASDGRAEKSESNSGDDQRSAEKRDDETSGKHTSPGSTASTPGAGPTGTPKARAPHKQLQRQGHQLNLRERQHHLRFDKLLQESGDEVDVDVRTADVMEALISWMKAGHPVKIFRLACDFGGMHKGAVDSDDDSEYGIVSSKPAMLDEQLFERLLDACHGVETLDLSECKLSSANYRALRRFLMHKDCKVDCLLFGGQMMFDKEVRRLARGLERNTSLTELSLCETTMATENLVRIIDAVILNPRINAVWLEEIDACFGALPAFGRLVAAGHCVHLAVSRANVVKIVGRDVHFWNGLFKDFCRKVAVNSSLRLLDLSGFELTNSNFRAIIRALKSNTRLEWLLLGKYEPSKAQTELIKTYLQRNRISNRKRLMPYGQAALDLLASAAVPGIWPRELSELIAAWMNNAMLEQMKTGIEAGFPRAKRSRKRKASASSVSTASAALE